MERTRVEIEYCVQCGWLLRAAWYSQELLLTFENDLSEVALIPGRGGVFELRLGNDLLFSRSVEGRFPEATEIKQKLRERFGPGSVLEPVGNALISNL